VSLKESVIITGTIADAVATLVDGEPGNQHDG